MVVVVRFLGIGWQRLMDVTQDLKTVYEVRAEGQEGNRTYSKVGAIQGFGEHPRISKILPRDLPVPVKAQIEEVEHLSDNRRSRLGEVPTNPFISISSRHASEGERQHTA